MRLAALSLLVLAALPAQVTIQPRPKPTPPEEPGVVPNLRVDTHLYHLARLEDEYPRYAALVTNANSARIFIFGLGEKISDEKVKGKKMQRVKVGGWSQARYQRRVENAHKSHAREAIDTLDRIVREENIQHIVIAGDPELAAQLPKHLADKLVGTLRLDTKAPEHEIFNATIEAIQQQDAATDADKVRDLFEQYRAGGLAVTGPQATLEALTNGQVDEILISTALEDPIDLADNLVTKAKQTSARVSFIEDANLLAPVDGVAAFLRWRV